MCQITKQPESTVVTEKKKTAITFSPVAHFTKYENKKVSESRKTENIMFEIHARQHYITKLAD